MADSSVSIDYWRKFFRSAGSDIFKVIEKAILVAASDCPVEFSGRRDRIAETLYTCQLDRCSGCSRAELRAPKGLEEDDGSDRTGEEEGRVNCDDEPEAMDPMVSGYSYDAAEALTEEIEEESRIVGEVLRIREVLTNQQDESDKVLFESLRRLQLMELSVETLKATEIGKAVNGLRRHNTKQIRQLVRTLIEGWKVLVDEWMKATAAIADTPPESVNPSVVSEEDGLPFPPLDEGALFASQTTTIELSQIFEGMDEDGNLRNNWEFEKNERKLQLGNGNPVRRQQVLCLEEKGRVGSEDAVTRQPKPLECANRPPKPQGISSRQCKAAVADLEPVKPSRLVLNKKASADSKSHHRQELDGVPKKPSTAAHNVSNESDESSIRAKLEIAKRKLHEGYRQAENAKKQRTIQVMEINDLPKQAQNQRQPSVKPRNHIRNLFNAQRQ